MGSDFCITLKSNFCTRWPAQKNTAWIHFHWGNRQVKLVNGTKLQVRSQRLSSEDFWSGLFTAAIKKRSLDISVLSWKAKKTTIYQHVSAFYFCSNVSWNIRKNMKKRWSSSVWANGHPDGYFIGQVGEMYCRPLEEDVSPRDWKHPYRFDAFGTESRHRNIF